MKNEKKYGLFTAIAMIVGIVIGSGIFFKSDDILVFTGGSIVKGIILFTLAAFSIVFGGITISVLANKCKKNGGIINYADIFLGRKFACIFGWFQTLVYYPTLICVVAWVSGIYICMLFGIEGTLTITMGIGFVIMIFLFLLNTYSAKLSGMFQVSAMVIKIIPLIAVSIMGIMFGNISTNITAIPNNVTTATSSFAWIVGLAPIAFSFDGWIVSTSIAGEIKNSEKNLTKALIWSPIFVLIIYILYFISISCLLGPQTVMELGNAHLDLLANNVLGSFGAKVVMTFVVISILGTVNGVTMAIIRNPYELSKMNLLPGSKFVNKYNEKLGLSTNSAIYSFVVCVIWYGIHFVTQKYNILPNSDISEIAIVTSYLCYIALYFAVIKMSKDLSFFRGKVAPILATFGSLFIFFGSMQNKLFWIYFGISVIIMIGSYIYYKLNFAKYFAK